MSSSESARLAAGTPGRSAIAAAFKAAFPVSLPVLAGYLFLGSAYGVLMSKIGYGPIWTAILSIMIFGGTIQFIATTLLASGFQPLYAFFISALVNARHLFYGFAMLERYSGTGWKKPFLVFWLTDETFSLVCSGEVPENVDPTWFRFFVSALNYCYWIGGGVVGNVAGTLFAFNSKGIDFVMTALFTVIVINQWREAKTHAPALIGLAASALCLICFRLLPVNSDYFIIPAMLLIVAAIMACRQRLEKDIRAEEEEACH